MTFETLFIDADDTIFDFGQAQKQAFRQMCEDLKYPFSERAYEIYDKVNSSFWQKLERGEITKNRLVLERFEELFRILKINGDVLKAEKTYRTYLGEQTYRIPGADEGIKKLRKKYKLFITTNGEGKTQRKRMEKSGLLCNVDGIFVSEEIGYNKPDKRYFQYCIEATQSRPELTLVIGDSPTSDLQGGLNAGLKTMWFNRKKQPRTVESDYTVFSWNELINTLL